MDLFKVRKEKAKSMSEVAAAAGISESYYSLIEAKKRRPSVQTAKKIAETLGFAWTRFYEDQEEGA